MFKVPGGLIFGFFHFQMNSGLFSVKEKKFTVIWSILSFCQRPLVDFWSIRNFYGKTDYMGKISKVSMCLKHVQSPRGINFWVFHFQMHSVHWVLLCQFAPYSEAYTLLPRSETYHDGAIFMGNINGDKKNLPDQWLS